MEESAARDPAESQQPSERWLAYELHDGLLQWIIAARMRVDVALVLSKQVETTWAKNLSEALEHLEAAMQEARQLIAFLESDTSGSPMRLETALAAYVESVADDAASNSQQINLVIDIDQPLQLSPPVQWNLLRIAQQALRNALQHAGPGRIEVRCGLLDDGRAMEVEVQDWGAGFDPQQPAADALHFGLSSMQHRAKLIHAEFDVQSAPGEGCLVRCLLPLESSAV